MHRNLGKKRWTTKQWEVHSVAGNRETWETAAAHPLENKRSEFINSLFLEDENLELKAKTFRPARVAGLLARNLAYPSRVAR